LSRVFYLDDGRCRGGVLTCGYQRTSLLGATITGC